MFDIISRTICLENLNICKFFSWLKEKAFAELSENYLQKNSQMKNLILWASLFVIFQIKLVLGKII